MHDPVVVDLCAGSTIRITIGTRQEIEALRIIRAICRYRHFRLYTSKQSYPLSYSKAASADALGTDPESQPLARLLMMLFRRRTPFSFKFSALRCLIIWMRLSKLDVVDKHEFTRDFPTPFARRNC